MGRPAKRRGAVDAQVGLTSIRHWINKHASWIIVWWIVALTATLATFGILWLWNHFLSKTQQPILQHLFLLSCKYLAYPQEVQNEYGILHGMEATKSVRIVLQIAFAWFAAIYIFLFCAFFGLKVLFRFIDWLGWQTWIQTPGIWIPSFERKPQYENPVVTKVATGRKAVKERARSVSRGPSKSTSLRRSSSRHFEEY